MFKKIKELNEDLIKDNTGNVAFHKIRLHDDLGDPNKLALNGKYAQKGRLATIIFFQANQAVIGSQGTITLTPDELKALIKFSQK